MLRGCGHSDELGERSYALVIGKQERRYKVDQAERSIESNKRYSQLYRCGHEKG